MITLGELLTVNTLKEFRFATKRIGLNNPIAAAGFFEWESKADIHKTFQKGEFVVTTLSIAKDDEELAFDSIRTLILNQAAAIAIKDIYFDSIPDNIIRLAEKNNIPILFFTDTYVDDVLFSIKMELLHESTNPRKEQLVSQLISGEHISAERKKMIINEINPYLIDSGLICAYIREKDVSSSDIPLSEVFNNGEFAKKFQSDELNPSKTIYMFIPFHDGLLFIYTTAEDRVVNFQTVTEFLEYYYHNKDKYFVGTSQTYDCLQDLDTALKEAIFAHTAGIINNERNTEFNILIQEHMLCSLCYNPWMERYYAQIYSEFESRNKDKANVILDTLITYVESEGDIGLTSKRTFQHSNTIRYRLSKVKKMLNIERDPAFFSQAYSFVTLYKIHSLLDPIFNPQFRFLP